MSALPRVHATTPAALELEAGTYWWCSCGLSAHQPMCDGSHKGTGFFALKFTLSEKKRVWLCNCKHSQNQPYCDGSHARLPAQAL